MDSLSPKFSRVLSWTHYRVLLQVEDTDEDIARYSILHGNEQLFATKYKLYLPTEEELRAEIEMQKEMFYLQQQEKKRDSVEKRI